MISPERLSAWRIFPRLLITLYGFSFYRTTEWFMQLPDPTNAQSAFVSVVMGVMTGIFGIWMGHEHKGESNVNSSDRTSK